MKWPTFKTHCVLGLSLRIILIAYANFHDKYFAVPYTDVDYKVYTDAARLITNGESPYDRHTYRYTPLLAFILTPNILLHFSFGKIIFSIIDIVVTLLIKKILLHGLCSNKCAELCALTWLYNPMTIVISTRGNADSLAVAFVLLTLYYLEIDNSLLSGFIHGISVHFRLYPVAFSLVMYLSLRNKNYFIPNKRQLQLVFSCLFSLGILTAISYYYYGYKFLYESLIYHLVRKDARHNFSIYFYMLYLSTGQYSNIIERILRVLPPIILLIALSFRYSNKIDLKFAMLMQAMVMVTYNSVITSQYFFWYLSLLPLCLPYIKMSFMRCVLVISLWIGSQGLWLLDAYYLEFFGINKFHSLWIDSILFFFANIKIILDLITNYNSDEIVLKNK
ncbi:hypothetical protein PV326_013360 [Microctonus aethiopoides]|uniref:GPI alpha-1,4-mannosyltransferase I, catalytic subunit n=1 Tax=Microctonus aethiopoides TaxID=144406 RepID=A0AA39FPM4_9HYME|nr:hypothetical protein PV326_013360 [Microctonus aethiopoides]KAK0173505.1 hypothetical protein PV328_006691 [Microctonus aethiopoides]